jgi:hypothetical protein
MFLRGSAEAKTVKGKSSSSSTGNSSTNSTGNSSSTQCTISSQHELIENALSLSGDLLGATLEAQSLGRYREANAYRKLAHERLVKLGRYMDKAFVVVDSSIDTAARIDELVMPPPLKAAAGGVNKSSDPLVAPTTPVSSGNTQSMSFTLPLKKDTVIDAPMLEHLARAAEEYNKKSVASTSSSSSSSAATIAAAATRAKVSTTSNNTSSNSNSSSKSNIHNSCSEDDYLLPMNSDPSSTYQTNLRSSSPMKPVSKSLIWTENERRKCNAAAEKYGEDYAKIAAQVKTRTEAQVKAHLQYSNVKEGVAEEGKRGEYKTYNAKAALESNSKRRKLT